LRKFSKKNYNVPYAINTTDAKSYGAITELNNLAEAISNWSIELEIAAYTLESLNLLGIIDLPQRKMSYLEKLKTEFEPKSGGVSMGLVFEFLIGRLLKFSLSSLSKMALAKGISQISVDTSVVFNVIYQYAVYNTVPWQVIMKTLNLPWLLGGFATSLIINKCGDYFAKEEVTKKMKELTDTFVIYTEFIDAQREAIMDAVQKYYDSEVSEEQRKKLKGEIKLLVDNLVDSNMVTQALRAHKFTKSEDEYESLSEHMFVVRESEDYVIIDERRFVEIEDDSGFIIVEEKTDSLMEKKKGLKNGVEGNESGKCNGKGEIEMTEGKNEDEILE